MKNDEKGDREMNQKWNRILGIWLAATMVILPFAVMVGRADTEPNDDFSEAELIMSIPATIEGSFTAGTDRYDIYIFYMPAGEPINISLSWVGASVDLDLYLFNMDYYNLDYSEYYNPERINIAAPYTGYYYILIYDYSKSTVNYNLSINTTTAITPPDNNVRVGDIANPNTYSIDSQPFNPAAIVQNIGNNQVSFSVEGKIYENYFVEEFSNIPLSGWTNVSVAGSNTWERTTTTYRSEPSSYRITFQYPVGDDWLISPQITPNAGDILTFWTRVGQSGWPTWLEVNISTGGNNISDFTTGPLLNLSDEAGNLSEFWTLHSIDLTPWAGIPIYIGFHSYNADGATVYLDDVMISSASSLVWSDTVSVSNLAPGSVETVNFSTFTPIGGKYYTFITFANLSNDFDVFDNTEIYTFYCVEYNPITLSNRTVFPSSGPYIQGNPLYINISYKHTENTAPTTANIILNNVSYPMTGTGTSYSQGVVYTFDGSSLPAGNYTYTFYFSDSTYNKTLPATGNYSITIYPPDDEYEQNDNMSQAQWIEPGVYQLKAYDNDWYKINCTAGLEIVVTITFPSGDLDLYLKNENNSTLDSSTSYSSLTEEVSYVINTTGVYYIYVLRYSGYPNYTMTITLGAPNPITLTSGSANPEEAVVGETVYFNVTYENSLNEAPTVARVFIDGTSHEMTSNGSTDYQNGVKYTYMTSSLAVGTHTFYFYFESGNFNKTYTPYYNEIVILPPDDMFEENYDIANASGMPAGTYNDLVCYDDDYYKVWVPAGANLTVVITFIDENGDLDLRLYNSTGSQIDYSIGSTDYEEVSITNATEGYYYIRVEPVGSVRTTYNMTIYINSSRQNQPPVLTNGNINPTSGDESTVFTASVQYSDPDGDPAVEVLLGIFNTDTLEYEVYKMSTTDNITFTYSFTLPFGNYSIVAIAADWANESEDLDLGTIRVAPPVTHTAITVTLQANATEVLVGSTVNLSGTVLYEDNTPVPAGTPVAITGTPGTTTNADGTFSLEVTINTNTTFKASATVGSFSNESAEVTVVARLP
ncbi:MAG: pre-peptidase C-terminal domain-containing protein, partial [Thermoplasmata archaeon]